MRLRNIQGAKEIIENNSYVIKNPKQHKGQWRQVFQNDHPIYLEIGMGKGKFLTTMASKYPAINFIGIEKFSSVLIRALEKQQALLLPNLYFLREDAEHISEFFAPDEISRIYLNFSDPWPKDRHAKRRLTSKEFFQRYCQILEPNGEVQFKTDNLPLFEFSLSETIAAEWEIIEKTFDLHHSSMATENVMTEYEEKFSARGNPIYKMTVKQSVNKMI